ncbi:MAG: hypothetical protein ABFR31_10130 [Thermodesulfobacteriota bacterium]
MIRSWFGKYLITWLALSTLCTFFLVSECFAQDPLTVAAPLAPVRNKTIEPNQTLAGKIKYQTPLKKGTIASLGNQQIQLGKTSTTPLKAVARVAFKPINKYTNIVNQRAIIGKTILSKPVILDEAIEFEDSFVLRKSMTITVLNPKEMKQISPTFKSYLSRQKHSKRIDFNALDPESKKGLSELMKTVNSLEPGDPIRKAAAKGKQAVLDAIAAGKGELTIEDTIVVPKFIPKPVKGITMYPGVQNGRLNFKKLQPVSLPVLKELNRVSPPVKFVPVTQLETKPLQMMPKDPKMPEYSKSGKHTFTAEFLTGFTRGHSWQWERKWSYNSGFFRVTIGGGYGFGLRVPVRATGELSPTNIYRYDVRDNLDNLQGRMTAQTLDADENYYKRTGMSPSKIFRGNEVVLEQQLGFGFKLRALWKDLAHKPFNGFGLNYSQNARPPWGANCTNCGFHIPIPPEITQTTLEFSVMTGFVQTGFHVNGTGKAILKFTPFYNGNPASSVSMMFDKPGYKPFNLHLPRLSPPSGQDLVSQQFGFKLSEPTYRMGLSITPEVRVGVNAGYKNFSRTFATEWIPLNMLELKMGTIELHTHEGTKPDYTFTEGIKTFKKIKKAKFDPKKTKQMPKLKIN